MSIDLEVFLGTTCLLQFRDGNAVAMSRCEKGVPSPLAMQGDGGPRLVPVPFLQGEIVKAGKGFAVRIKDDKGATLDIAVNLDAVLCVTSVHSEAALISMVM